MNAGTSILAGLAWLFGANSAAAAAAEGLPPGLGIRATDLGEVYVDASGRTLYTLSRDDKPGVSNCTDTQFKEGTDGFRGVKHPLNRLDKRPTCLQKARPASVLAEAVPTGRWSILDRTDGSRQWMYDRRPVYTSIKDRTAGEVNGVFGRPLFVPVPVPPEVTIQRAPSGGAYFASTGSRPLLLRKDGCKRDCAGANRPFAAPELAQPLGRWRVSMTSEGIRQWAYDGHPVYVAADNALPERADTRIWAPLAIARSPAPPADFTTFRTTPGRTTGGRIVTTKSGATVYVFGCQEDGPDRLDCDDPADGSALWTTLCGNLARCADLFRPVVPSARARSDGKVWTIVTIPAPWAPVRAGEGTGGTRVWAYRGRPVFTYAKDRKPGDTDGELGYQGRAWTAVEAPELAEDN